MKQLILIFVLSLIGVSALWAQTPGQPISIRKTLGENQFYQGSTRLTLNQALTVMTPNDAAYLKMKKAQSNNTVATIFGCAGGFMIGWPLGAAAASDDANWTMAGIGVGLVAISIPFMVKTTRYSEEAVDLYNEGLPGHSGQSSLQFKLQVNGDGVGLVMRF